MSSLRKRGRRLRRSQRGVTAMEYALAAPLLFAVIFIAIEVAFIMLADAHLDVAANRVARLGRIGFDTEKTCDTAVREVMTQTLSGWASAGEIRVDAQVYTPGQSNDFSDVDDENYKPVCDTGERGDMVIYRLGFDRPGLTGFISWLGLSRVRFERVILIQNE
ncbi:TadE/TadG family type IV pilus assembly protein [Brenneria populi subsp. brevivirga]|uniref:TadE/TadG family type IV pilus assembly protein n=1 Tax=Brenneria populi TaxID=1505588 RepID=UPI002E18715D|nr:TadE/TadG family type IV pilus assembly protein [Brenneria populi subsp. brevivirga]